jgi:hypothetical protein
MDTQNTLAAIVAAVLAAVWPFVRAWVQAKLTPQRVAHVMDIARIAVRAAEKLGDDLAAAGVTAATSASKLNYAADVVVSGAKRLGVKLTQDEVLAFVHAALREMEQVDYSALPVAH